MTLHEFGVLLLSLLTAIGGQFFLKAGALKLGKANAGNAVAHVLAIVTTPELMVGLALYGLSAVLYILLLTRVKLSVVGPAVSISYIFSVLMGYFIFKESIPFNRLIGLALIACGVVLVVWKE
ncbi:EamA-like transporter family protein [Kovacikia minuta CCNUW1]|uniref:EamA-like transporter family protein n=1 Tax=Kovacikia minuta TaxID=2931930 RepID=UPI001CCE5D7C|nr:EamA-like transporter family protein [Kovacikia minuta]UBF29135.1 EamA-like transporter family protein [Kovacikia minuta CCNUW1]